MGGGREGRGGVYQGIEVRGNYHGREQEEKKIKRETREGGA